MLRKIGEMIKKNVYFLQKGIPHELNYLIVQPKNNGTFFEESHKERSWIIISIRGDLWDLINLYL